MFFPEAGTYNVTKNQNLKQDQLYFLFAKFLLANFKLQKVKLKKYSSLKVTD